MATEAPAETAASTARTVKDVNPHAFVKAYSAHLKRSGKVTHPALSDPSLWLSSGRILVGGVALLLDLAAVP
jgi:hypothetical protein